MEEEEEEEKVEEEEQVEKEVEEEEKKMAGRNIEDMSLIQLTLPFLTFANLYFFLH